MQIRIWPHTTGTPVGKLADAELHFTDGPLEGLKLLGFSVWERRGGGVNVTFPARTYSVNGERRSFALLRPLEDVGAQERIRDLIVDAWLQFAKAQNGERPAPPRSEPRYEYDEPRPRETGTTGRRAASFPQSPRRFNRG